MTFTELNFWLSPKFKFIIILGLASTCKPDIEPLYEARTIELEPGATSLLAPQLSREVSLQVDEELKLQLWAPDTLVQDPIAISIDNRGRVFYTQATRQEHSEFDIRGHPNWMTASISFQTVEDRREFLKKTFAQTNEEGERFLQDLNGDGSLDWKDLAVEKEQVWFIEDISNDGFADRAQLYLEDFNQEVTDVANGIESHGNQVFIAVGPDMWSTTDRDNDGIADQISSLSSGYAVHIGFSGHGMSGAKIGPDGRIWWGIGDIGMNVVDKEGNQWAYPNQGVIVRSELDGSGFEVYASGLRNTHEFAFDQYGNLISVDNDGDHPGERERLVYLINGSETGWRINWQFGKYTDPENNQYKVWMDEKLHVPHWEGQAAYILPPIMNYVNGPTGLVYNPGTALDEQWKDYFFIAEFRGTPAQSPVHAFKLKPSGASFVMEDTKEVVRGILPTGLDFGPEGALYIADWIDGWGTKDAGRIWKLDIPSSPSQIRDQVKSLLQSDFGEYSNEELSGYLSHDDQRIRQKSQFELVSRGNKGYQALLNALEQSSQLARIHAIWGIGQYVRMEDLEEASVLIPLLQDNDPEIQTQAAKILGDVRFVGAAPDLVSLLTNASLRVQLHACEALGRMGYTEATDGVVNMLAKNNDSDLWLRHAGMVALARMADGSTLAELAGHQSEAVRVAAVVALRRMKSPLVSEFLDDASPLIVIEAARAINDDFSIPEALPALAGVLNQTQFQDEPLIRRSINANLRLGNDENLEILQQYLSNMEAPAAMRSEAIAALATWGNPSVFDRVDGRYRGKMERADDQVKDLFANVLPSLLNDTQAEIQIAAAKAAGKLKIAGVEDQLLTLLSDHPQPDVRSASLAALFDIESSYLNRTLEIALADDSPQVRSQALSMLPESELDPQQAVNLLSGIMARGTLEEKQSALTSLGSIKHPESIALLKQYMNRLIAGSVADEIKLDLILAAEAQENEQLQQQITQYQQSKPKDDPLSPFMETIAGGDPEVGANIFYRHEAAQCVRCHTIFEVGGTAGPGLAGVGKKMTPLELLQAVVEPSATFAEGYQIVTLQTGSETLSGEVLTETTDSIKLRMGDQGLRSIAKSEIEERRSVPSSMPPMGSILTKSQIRDVVAFLHTLDGEE